MDKTYEERLTEAVVSGVRDIGLYPLGGFYGWSNLRAQIVEKLLSEVPGARKSILEAIDKLLKDYDRYAFGEVLNGKEPDHTWSEQALAYSLLHYEFTEVELKFFKFDHSETFGSFIIYNKPWELPERILEYISTVKPPIARTSRPVDGDPHCCCCR